MKMRRLYPSEWASYQQQTGAHDSMRDWTFLGEDGRITSVHVGPAAVKAALKRPIKELERELFHTLNETVRRITALSDEARRIRLLELTRDVFDAGDLNQITSEESPTTPKS